MVVEAVDTAIRRVSFGSWQNLCWVHLIDELDLLRSNGGRLEDRADWIIGHASPSPSAGRWPLRTWHSWPGLSPMPSSGRTTAIRRVSGTGGQQVIGAGSPASLLAEQRLEDVPASVEVERWPLLAQAAS